MRIQTKVTLLFVISTAALLFLLSSFFFLYANYYAFEDFYKRLETRVRIAWTIHSSPGTEDEMTAQELRREYLEKLPSEREYIYEIAPAAPMAAITDAHIPSGLVQSILAEGQARDRNRNVFYAGSLYENESGKFIVIVSANDPYSLQELHNLRRILVVAFFISMIAVYMAGKFFSFQTFKPVRQIIQDVQGITAQNLHQRLNTGNGKDEINQLAQTFNNMLNRLETAFETQNNFVSNASHELRTPLTIIKGEAELALKKPGLSEVHAQSLHTIFHEAEKLNEIINGLLDLAQSGFNGKKQNWELIRIDELIWMVKDSVDRLYPDNQLQINFSRLPDEEKLLQVSGNVNLLKLAVSNIVLNACKYSDNQVVIVGLFSENNRIIISVTDQGIGIPENEVQHIFEPFFRASNTGNFEGYGIGLPLALNIIRLHKGTLAIHSKEFSGTEIRIILPVTETAD